MTDQIHSAPKETAIASPIAQPIAAKKKTWLARTITEVMAIFIWSYVILKLFVRDIDRDIFASFAPGYVWLLNFKLIAVLGVVVLTLLFVRKWGGWLRIGYIALYPIILIGWKMPYWLFKQRSWPLAIAVINALTSFFGSLKYTVSALAVFSLAASLILFLDNQILLWTSAATVGILLIIAYARRLIAIFRPSGVYRVYETIASALPKLRQTACVLEDQIKDVPFDRLTPEQATKWQSTLQNSFILSRLCLFAARKLRDYGRSGYGKIAAVFIFLFLVAVTVVVFSLINLALYKINPAYFRATDLPTLFTFIDYSFNRIIFQSIPDLTAVTIFSKSIYNLEALFGLFLVGMLVSLLVSTRSERQAQELSQTVTRLETESDAMERTVLAEYRFANAAEALAALGKLQNNLVVFIYKLSSD